MDTNELCRKALDLIGSGKKASMGMFQRELGIGYLDALRTLVLLERKGLVSQDGAELRETLLKSLESDGSSKQEVLNGVVALHHR